jgi:arylsulfatase A-like enzyme
VHEGNETLPRLLSRNGYVTGMAGKWHLGKLQLDEESEIAEVDPQTDAINTPELNAILKKHQQHLQKLVQRDAGFDHARSVIWTNNDDFHIKKLTHHNFPWVSKGAVDLLKQFKEQDKPFFLYVASTACHGPHHGESLEYDMRNTQEGRVDEVVEYLPDTEKIKEQIKDLNRFEQYKHAGMAELDHHAGIILKTLKELDLEENTIVVFMSDHNVEPGKASCYEKGLHVPMLMRWPGRVEPGSKSDALVQNVDILPTVLEAAGIDLPAEIRIDGASLIPLVSGGRSQVHDYLFADSGYARSVNDGRYKYSAFGPPQEVIDGMKNGKVEYAPNTMNVFKQAHAQISMQYYPGYFDQDQLYDLEKDPYEQNNLARDPDYASVLETLRSALKQHLATFPNAYDLETIPFMETDKYRELAANTKALGTEFISWWKGRKLDFPPE